MTSKWIRILEKTRIVKDPIYLCDIIYWDSVIPSLERIDKLLREAMAGTDNEDLHDRIFKEIGNVAD